MARLSETRYKRKSQQKSIKEDFLNFINSGVVKYFIGEEAQKGVYFIVNGYTDAFIDKIKIHLFKNKEADFQTLDDLITKLPRYDNYTPLASDFLSNYFDGGLMEHIYHKILQIILDVLSMLEQKENYAKNELGADIQKAFNSIKNKAEKWLNVKLDHDTARKLLTAYTYEQADINDIDDIWYEDYGAEIEKYFKVDLGFEKITDEYGDIVEINQPKKRLTFQEIIGIQIDDITLGIIIPFLDFINQIGYVHKVAFKKRITDEEKQPINEFLYELNDVFGLGIKKEINDGLFVSLIIDGYFALQEKDEN